MKIEKLKQLSALWEQSVQFSYSEACVNNGVEISSGWHIYCYTPAIVGTEVYVVEAFVPDKTLGRLTEKTAEKLGKIAYEALARRVCEDMPWQDIPEIPVVD